MNDWPFDKASRENAFKRGAGQSADVRRFVAAQTSETPCWGRCRHCGVTTKATQAVLCKDGCSSCGAKLERKPHASSNSNPEPASASCP